MFDNEDRAICSVLVNAWGIVLITYRLMGCFGFQMLSYDFSFGGD
jgi:hypothetical protein